MMDSTNNNELCSMNTTNYKSSKLELIQNLSKGTQTNEKFQTSVEYQSNPLDYGVGDQMDIGDKLPECNTMSVVEFSNMLTDCQIDEDNLHNNQLKSRMLNTETNLLDNNSDGLLHEKITEYVIPREISQNINEIVNFNELNKEKRIIDLENQNNDFVEKIKTMNEENEQLKMEIRAIKSFVDDRFRFENSCSNMNNEILRNVPMKHCECFEYRFENISQMRTVWERKSDIFYSHDGKYKMSLELWPRGCSHEHRDSHVCIQFKIIDPPPSCRVTLNIAPQTSANQHKITVEKYLNFDKDSPEKTLPQFHLSIQDLKKIDVVESDCLLVSCNAHI